MKRVLYITNIEVPYKVKFFNELAKETNLTVVYERKSSSNRDSSWSQSEKSQFNKIYLEGIKVGNENAFSLSILGIVSGNYDEIIVSCINSPVQLLAILYMKLRRIKYTISFDGEMFMSNPGIKSIIKKSFIIGADKYLTAGEVSANNIKTVVNSKEVYPYYFSSYTSDELNKNASLSTEREKFVLVVGQYFEYKGLDLAVKLAKLDNDIRYKFVGMGKRTELFVNNEEVSHCSNIEVVPFLNKEDLNKEYQSASLLLLPSRQECWGLVINEAASFGLPIVATKTSGAAVEFLTGKYSKFLKNCNDIEGIYNAVKEILDSNNDDYSAFLIEKSKQYSIERMVRTHVDIIEA